MTRTRYLIAAGAACLIPHLAHAAEYNRLVADQSRITFTARQMNVPAAGTFGKFSGQLAFDPARPEAGRAQLDIDIASIDGGSEEVNDELRRKAWFDTANFPAARFVSTAVKSLGGGRYEASGKMTIKGHTRDVSVPFTFRSEGASGVFDGGVTIRRLQFAVGEGAWADTTVVADEVAIHFRLVVAAAAAAAPAQPK